MFSFLVKSDQITGKRNRSRISEKIGQMLYSWKKNLPKEPQARSKGMKLDQNLAFSPPHLPVFLSPTELTSFYHHLLVEGQRLQAPSFFCASIIVITQVTTGVVKESCIFFRKPTCLSSLEGTYLWCLSLCICMHSPLRIVSYLFFLPHRDRYSRGRK